MRRTRPLFFRHFPEMHLPEIAIPAEAGTVELPQYELFPLSFAQKLYFEAPVRPLKGNQKLILRERITVTGASEDVEYVALSLRVTCSFDDVFLRGRLVLQNRPSDEVRLARLPEGQEPGEPSPPTNIDPAEYNGRRNWLASLEEVCAEEGGTRGIVRRLDVLCGDKGICFALRHIFEEMPPRSLLGV